MTTDSLHEKIGLKRGSPFLPFGMLLLVVVVFAAQVDPFEPDIALGEARPGAADVWVVGRTAGDSLHFLGIGKSQDTLFDVSEADVREHYRAEAEEALRPSSDRGIVPDLVEESLQAFSYHLESRDTLQFEQNLEALRSMLDTLWGKELAASGKDQLFEQLNDVIGDLVYQRATGLRKGIVRINRWSAEIERMAFHDFPRLLRAQVSRAGQLILLALIPGLLGSIYRRAFARWFLVSFTLLFAANWLFDVVGHGTITQAVRSELHDPASVENFLIFEMFVVVLLMVFRFRSDFRPPDGKERKGLLPLAILSLSLTLGLGVVLGQLWAWWAPMGTVEFLLGVVLVLMLLRISHLLLRRWASPVDRRPKNIVMCLDGTWNYPGQTDFGHPAQTNVFKLFTMLKQRTGRDAGATRHHASLFKRCTGTDAERDQVAFYYNGVGNMIENSQLGQLFGGAFGMGAAAIVERAYLDVVTEYRPGDRIFIFGFSRGAAIARVLAAAIESRGIPASVFALRLFGRPWLLWKSPTRDESVPIEVLGCWDTVGAFGIPKDVFGIPFQKTNLLKDLKVPLQVRRAYHMVALDEMRDIFVPTPMEADPTDPLRVTEVWFSGNHSNVGGGYETDGLSDVTLDFLLRRVSSGYVCLSENRGDTSVARQIVERTPGDESWGLLLEAIEGPRHLEGRGRSDEDSPGVVRPDPTGQLRSELGGIYAYGPRKLPTHAVIHDTVIERIRTVPAYAPQGVFDLGKELLRKRASIEKGVKDLEGAGSLDRDEVPEDFSTLSIVRWSVYQGQRGDFEHEECMPTFLLANRSSVVGAPAVVAS